MFPHTLVGQPSSFRTCRAGHRSFGTSIRSRLSSRSRSGLMSGTTYQIRSMPAARTREIQSGAG